MSGVPNTPSVRLSDEECRLLIASEEERLRRTMSGRWEVEDEIPPERRVREALADRKLIRLSPLGVYRITPLGRQVLDHEIRSRVVDRLANEAQELGIY